MPATPEYDDLIRPLAELITRFLDGEWSYAEFQRRFKPALSGYQRAIGDRPYWPLDVIADIPAHCRESLRDYCRQALDRLPKEALDRSTRVWIESTLIQNDGSTYYSFGHGDQSRFGSRATFYWTAVEEGSFLLSALHGTITPPPFRFATLLSTLREAGGDELASWVYGTEPDGALAIINRVWSLGDAYQEADQVRHIEREPAGEGGPSYLMLLPKSKRWMLLNTYDEERFTIELHGPRELIADVAARLGIEPQWD